MMLLALRLLVPVSPADTGPFRQVPFPESVYANDPEGLVATGGG